MGTKVMQLFMSGKWTATPYATVSEAEFTKAERKAKLGYGCSRVMPATIAKPAKKPVYVKTTLGFPDAETSEWVYKNVCPLAAAQMKACYRCPQKDGLQVPEYFKFGSEADFKAYKKFKWVPTKVMQLFMSGKWTATPYATVSEAEFTKAERKAKLGDGCSRVMPATIAKPAKKPVYVKTTLGFPDAETS